jgi:hypothetical protein
MQAVAGEWRTENRLLCSTSSVIGRGELIDPDLHAKLRYGGRRPVGCGVDLFTFRLFAWTCVVVVHATNLVRNAAHGW